MLAAVVADPPGEQRKGDDGLPVVQVDEPLLTEDAEGAGLGVDGDVVGEGAHDGPHGRVEGILASVCDPEKADIDSSESGGSDSSSGDPDDHPKCACNDAAPCSVLLCDRVFWYERGNDDINDSEPDPEDVAVFTSTADCALTALASGEPGQIRWALSHAEKWSEGVLELSGNGTARHALDELNDLCGFRRPEPRPISYTTSDRPWRALLHACYTPRAALMTRRVFERSFGAQVARHRDESRRGPFAARRLDGTPLLDDKGEPFLMTDLKSWMAQVSYQHMTAYDALFDVTGVAAPTNQSAR